jgi:hypothetical protein
LLNRKAVEVPMHCMQHHPTRWVGWHSPHWIQASAQFYEPRPTAWKTAVTKVCASPSADADEKKRNDRPIPGTEPEVPGSAAPSKVITATGLYRLP